MRRVVALLVVLLTLTLSGCSTTPQEPVPIRICAETWEEDRTIFYVGGPLYNVYKVTLTAYRKFSSLVDYQVDWQSDNEAILTFDTLTPGDPKTRKAVLVPRDIGTVTIRASEHGNPANQVSATVVVLPGAPLSIGTGITIDGNTATDAGPESYDIYVAGNTEIRFKHGATYMGGVTIQGLGDLPSSAASPPGSEYISNQGNLFAGYVFYTHDGVKMACLCSAHGIIWKILD